MKYLHKITFILLVIGGLNWLLVAFAGWGIGNYLGDAGAKILYVLVGVSAVYEIFTHMARCKGCGKK